MKWFKRTAPQQASPTSHAGFFSTHNELILVTAAERAARLQKALARTFQKEHKLQPIAADGTKQAGSFAMDEAYPAVQQANLFNVAGQGWLPDAQLEWYANQGFIGWQTCAILAQNWLIDKACSMPGRDAVRNGWEIAVNDGEEIDPEILDDLRKLDKKYGLKRNCIQFVKMGRIFGIRIAMFNVRSNDPLYYEKPFNPDGVMPGSYKGITQIDPYWVAPEFDIPAASNPAAPDFYEPTWWRINGIRYHRSHLVIMRNGDELPDILKPSYIYGGIPTPQKIFERVYAAERTANEAPMLAMTKRLTALKVDITEALTDATSFAQKMATWAALRDNFGVKVIGEGEEIEQFDTNLTSLDETIMTQYQLVAAAANVPATKLLGTTPKGFNATGEYEEASYHEELESLQENDLSVLIARHYLLAIRSYIAPKHGIAPFHVDVQWRPVDSPTAEEKANTNKIKADTDKVLVDAGALDSLDVRQRLIADPDSGYNGIEEMVEGGPGDRDAEQEEKQALLEGAKGDDKKAPD